MSSREYSAIVYEKRDRRATITINRPEKYNACNSKAVSEICNALLDSWADSSVGVVVFTGSGTKAFCTGGDQETRSEGGYAHNDKEADPMASIPLEEGWQFVTYLLRHIPKPVIARVNGYAIGGGHVWQVNCDLSIAAESASLGQAGPRVGSFDPGYGTGELSRAVGIRKAKEIWLLARRYSASEAREMGLVNFVVPDPELDREVDRVCDELLRMSPTALKMIKYSFLADSEGLAGITELGVGGLSLYYGTGESSEGRNAFMEKRKPEFWKYYEQKRD
ncbi:MAG: enoyl-CoA hydratase-related protein [Candidatus Thermoplasmatota archaeon]|nr:enoyl-CoA hydratase-related protein [Candidatus Thermoplasmatota archaeon]